MPFKRRRRNYSLCPICQRKGIQRIIDGFLCYIHKIKTRKGDLLEEKCCRWAQVANMSDLLGEEDKEVILFVNVDLLIKNKKGKKLCV